MEEKEKMKLGLWYDANNDKNLIHARVKAMDLCFQLNNLKPSLEKEREEVLEKLLGYKTDNLILLSPYASKTP